MRPRYKQQNRSNLNRPSAMARQWIFQLAYALSSGWLTEGRARNVQVSNSDPGARMERGGEYGRRGGAQSGRPATNHGRSRGSRDRQSTSLESRDPQIFA